MTEDIIMVKEEGREPYFGEGCDSKNIFNCKLYVQCYSTGINLNDLPLYSNKYNLLAAQSTLTFINFNIYFI